jgi:hypothetical protein
MASLLFVATKANDYFYDFVIAIISGLFSGLLMFIALYITIKHERMQLNKQLLENKKEQETLFRLSVMPILIVSLRQIKTARDNAQINNCILFGDGKPSYIECKLIIENVGNGYCSNIILNNKEDIYRSLKRGDILEEDCVLSGVVDNAIIINFDGFEISFSDTYGRNYLQSFSINMSNAKYIISPTEPKLL